MPRKSNLEIVNGGRAVHRERRRQTAPHQVRENRRHSALDDVPAHPPNDLPSEDASLEDGVDDRAEVFTRQNSGQGANQALDAGTATVGSREIGHFHFAPAFPERNRAQTGEVHWLEWIAAAHFRFGSWP